MQRGDERGDQRVILIATHGKQSVPSYTIRLRTGQPLTSPPVTLTTWRFVTITNNETQEVTTISP